MMMIIYADVGHLKQTSAFILLHPFLLSSNYLDQPLLPTWRRSWAVWAAGSLTLQLSHSLAADSTLYATTTPVSWQVSFP